MKANERAEFVEVIEALAATFGREPTQAMLTGYWMGLEDLELVAVKRAAAKAIASDKFMPVPAVMRELAGELSPKQRAVLAWGAFKSAVDTHGFYASVDFDDQTINATVRNLGGWMPTLDQMETEGDKWIRKDFERVYEAFAATGIGPDLARPLLGQHEQNNIQSGHHKAIKPPVLVITGLPVRKRIETRTRKPPAELAGLLENTLRSPNPKGS